MERTLQRVAAVLAALLVAGCGRGVTVIETTPKQTIGTGTVTGIVTASDGRSPLADRIVEATNVATSERTRAQTNGSGGYTLRLAPGRYRIELRLQPGETLTKKPDKPMDIEVGEIETRVDFAVHKGAGRVSLPRA